jgi:parvulin-like peptidyl-prolyl isomerase
MSLAPGRNPEPPAWRDARRISSARSFALMGFGAVAGLIIAGYALFTAKGTSTLMVPAEDVALVNQQPISRSDYLAQLQARYSVDLAHATAEQRRKALDDMIREELFVQRGKELDVAATDSDVRSATVNAVEQTIAADAISAQPSDAKLRAYYDAHRARYAGEGSMTALDIVFANPEDAAAAVRALAAGVSAADVTSRFHGRNSGRLNGEEFYFAAKIHLGDALFDAAQALPDGGASQPVAASDGVHVLVMASNKRPVQRDFAAARAQVLIDWRNEAIARLQADDAQFLRKRANILIADDLR